MSNSDGIPTCNYCPRRVWELRVEATELQDADVAWPSQRLSERVYEISEVRFGP